MDLFSWTALWAIFFKVGKTCRRRLTGRSVQSVVKAELRLKVKLSIYCFFSHLWPWAVDSDRNHEMLVTSGANEFPPSGVCTLEIGWGAHSSGGAQLCCPVEAWLEECLGHEDPENKPGSSPSYKWLHIAATHTTTMKGPLISSIIRVHCLAQGQCLHRKNVIGSKLLTSVMQEPLFYQYHHI